MDGVKIEKEACGLDITLDDIRSIENQYDVTIRIHFDKIARAWYFDFEKYTCIERQVLTISSLRDRPKDDILKDFVIVASGIQMKAGVALAK